MKSPLVVLLAEDNAGDVLLVHEALREHELDFEIFVARDSRSMTELLARVGNDVPRPDVLLLDLNLPGIDGKDLFVLVREHPLCADVPLIVITSSDSDKDRHWTDTFGVTHYFRKPSDYEEFIQLGTLVREAVEIEKPE
jgi:CheY-like chemotaxis protein